MENTFTSHNAFGLKLQWNHLVKYFRVFGSAPTTPAPSASDRKRDDDDVRPELHEAGDGAAATSPARRPGRASGLQRLGRASGLQRLERASGFGGSDWQIRIWFAMFRPGESRQRTLSDFDEESLKS